MNTRFALLSALCFLAAPLAYAHTDGGVYGTPKTYCEDVKGDTNVHEYGPPATGFVIAFAIDASIPPCPYDPQWDGHYEYSFGGTWLLACEADCPNPYGKAGDGTLICWGTYADHPVFPTIYVTDELFTPLFVPVPFTVAADYIDTVPPVDPTEPNCGDFESDYSGLCIDSCTVDWPPGKDGTYQVYVCGGTQGHIFTGPPPGGPKTKQAGC